MLVKIKQPGWQKFTGELGMAQFVDGVSISHINEREAYSLGGYIHVVEIDEDGNELRQVSHSVDMIDRNDVRANFEPPRKRLSEVLAEQAAAAAKIDPESEKAPLKVYTFEELEEIASEKGIAAIREIAEPYGIKGVSIKVLIAEILARQGS